MGILFNAMLDEDHIEQCESFSPVSLINGSIPVQCEKPKDHEDKHKSQVGKKTWLEWQ